METKSDQKATRTRYYDMQDIQDELYAKSKAGETFGDLLSLITTPENLKLAYRNVKGNAGSRTAGTDGETIRDIAKLNEEEYIDLMRRQFERYKPRKVRRVEIPKPNGDKRPLGIPCIVDRLVQQAILQVMEPIMEAKFNPHSYGFRPDRSTEHAIADCVRLMNRSHCTYAVDIDIKSFFDTVNHRKLMRQLWTLGIRDTKLLQIIQEMLRCPIKLPNGMTLHPGKGTPQGGILSPLLANVVLNELDWWLASQWQGFCQVMARPPKPQYSANGERHLGDEYKTLRKSRLKEFYFVRYADDLVIFCKTRKTATALKEAVTGWLSHRLKLTVSEEKTKIVNLKRQSCSFLGFDLRLQPKGDKLVTKTRMSPKAKKRTKEKLREAIKKVQRPPKGSTQAYEVDRYNALVVGVQNYFGIANHVTLDLQGLQWAASKWMKNRLSLGKGNWESINENNALRKRYGKSKQVRWIGGKPLVPIGYCKSRKPMQPKAGTCRYTPEGRRLLEKAVAKAGDERTLHYLMRHPVRGKSIEYNDNRLSLYSAQHGKCAITGLDLIWYDIHCHHKLPRSMGGTDEYKNLVLVTRAVHKLIHATQNGTISNLLSSLELTGKQLSKVNKLRVTAGLEPI